MCSHEKVKQINNLKLIIKKYFRFHLDKENFILVKDKTPKMVSKKQLHDEISKILWEKSLINWAFQQIDCYKEKNDNESIKCALKVII